MDPTVLPHGYLGLSAAYVDLLRRHPLANADLTALRAWATEQVTRWRKLPEPRPALHSVWL